MLKQLKFLCQIENMQKSLDPEFDFLSDTSILKSFSLPLTTQISEIYPDTYLYKLLTDRDKRPSTRLWKLCISAAKSVNASDVPIFAAELYYDILQKQIIEEKNYPPRDDTRPDDAPPNIVGYASDSGGGVFKQEPDPDDEEICK
jgi:hypothetical protein